MTLIIAHDKNFGIGKDGKLPWRIPEDLRHFKTVTMGQTCLVGRKTFVGLPPLLGRTLIVMSKANDIPEISKDTFIIGGKQIYEYCLSNGLVHTAIVTEIDGIWDCDTFMDRGFLDGFIKVQETPITPRCKICKYVKI